MISILFFGACSTKKDTVINRNWHALNSKYNVLYNGYNALSEGVNQLNATYTDNYWELLPVERLKVQEEITLSGEPQNPNFERAEEKATKAIQKHGMEINQRERNPQMDEAFLLLGKARYFDQRFIPALEAFNYILYKYPNSDKIAAAKIWREKVNIRLENEELAIENLKELLKKETLKDQDYADASAMLAQAYMNLKHLDSAARKLRIAAKLTKNNQERGRYYYIVGQLYNQLGHKDTANMAFNKVIELNRRSPRVYMINAHLQKIRNTDSDLDTKPALLEKLLELEENRENRPFLDKIYHQLAQFHLKNDSIPAAVTYFNKSIRATEKDRRLNAINYEALGEINFYNNQYKEAGAYFDSTLTNLGEHTKKYRIIQRKRDNLEDVILYEGVVQKNDSILYLVNASEADRIAYFETYIANLKAKEAEEAEKKELEKLQSGLAAVGNTPGKKAGLTKGEQFYFYNPVTVGYGKNEFLKRWGSRVLEDNWRLSDKTTISQEEIAEANNSAQEPGVTKDELYSTAYYINQIPKAKEVIDSLKTERNFANYQLGLIYKEKFKEYKLAAARLSTLLKSDPAEKLILPAKYNLYKIYELLGSSLADAVKNDITLNYPDSRYAEIINNPGQISDQENGGPEDIYTALYKQYENQEYEEVISGANKYINVFNGQEIAPKFEMLKAIATGRLKGFEDFKQALNYIALNYPNNPEGKEAQRMLDEQLPKMADTSFAPSTETGNYKLIYPFSRKNKEGIENLYETITTSLKDLKYHDLSISQDVYDEDKIFLVVHGFKQKEYALGYAELLNINKNYKVDNENFVVLSNNYKIIQIHKNLEVYLRDQSPPQTINK